MVRVIKVQPPSASDMPAQAAKRKEIIRKISIRSNRQNPIKKWNLVSNDDFQHALARYFRTKKLYYERRDREWAYRKAELKGLGIGRGPSIKDLTQLITCYYWNMRPLGPVPAKRELGQLFDGKPYDIIKDTSPEVAYQLYLLDQIIKVTVSKISAIKQYVKRMATHMKFTSFALYIKTLQSADADFGSRSFTNLLEAELVSPKVHWNAICAELSQMQNDAFNAASKAHKKQTGDELSYANFFKSQSHVAKLIDRPIPQRMKVNARRILNG
jgi:hypothetical protein